MKSGLDLAASAHAELIRVRGLVQGVGFRPAVWRLARSLGLDGWVANDGGGVSIYLSGEPEEIERFVAMLPGVATRLARVDRVTRTVACGTPGLAGFHIAASTSSPVRTGIVPDATPCADCRAEALDPLARRGGYAFTNCTRCGPRFSITTAVPYDRERTTMAPFVMCAACRAEFEAPEDRRFHAQPIACPDCGPRVALECGSRPLPRGDAPDDPIVAARMHIQRGLIVAVKGIGGFQLACDALNEESVRRLRDGKRRERKPFALMGANLEVIRRYCTPGTQEIALLESAAGPIVILRATGPLRVADSVAPGVDSLGFMLPSTPLHHLLLRGVDSPIVLTSGNLSDEPQAIANDEAKRRLDGIADAFLVHDREIVQRVDDSVARVLAGRPCVLRRSRGFAPAPLPLPAGFEGSRRVLAFGGELKNTFCLVRDGEALLSHHIGDLEEAATRADYRRALERYLALFGFRAELLAADAHPEYLSSKLAREIAPREGLELHEVQHHHAHLASCMAENGVPLDAPPIIGVALDGLGYGEDGVLWGGELGLVDYLGFERRATFMPVAMPGGAAAIHEPWRNTYAHLASALGWTNVRESHATLELCRFLESKELATLDAMIERGINSPTASSCGRLFDAVAAAIGICRERAFHEGQGAIELEASVDGDALLSQAPVSAYPFEVSTGDGHAIPRIDPAPMWRVLLDDLRAGTPRGVMAARFHRGLAEVLVRVVASLGRSDSARSAPATVALSGGVFQNKILVELVRNRLVDAGFTVFTHGAVPPNDGGLSLGQAVIAVARDIRAQSGKDSRCA